MIIDSSAVIAVLRDEPERDTMVTSILADAVRAMSVATWLEVAIVVEVRHDPVLSRRFDKLVVALDIDIAAVTPAQAAIARSAFRDFGKGRHLATLKGDDFAHTGLTLVDLTPRS